MYSEKISYQISSLYNIYKYIALQYQSIVNQCILQCQLPNLNNVMSVTWS